MPRKELGEPDENRRKATKLFDSDEAADEVCDDPETPNGGLRVQASACRRIYATDVDGESKNTSRDQNSGLRVRLNGKNDKPSAKAYAVKLLAMRTYTERGLREKLRGREYSAEETDEAIAYAKRCGYINDALIAQNALEKLSVKYGRRRIFAYLASKGIPKDVIEALDLSEIDFKENARNLATKMSARGKPYEKIAASLSRAGFSSSEIYYAMSVVQ